MKANLLSRSGIIAIPRRFAMTQELLPTQSKFVIPANADIHLDSHQVIKKRMDSGFRRNDTSNISPRVGTNLIPRLRAEGRLTRLQGSM